jgi:sirohydrochlorin cobaltochelatase
MAHLVRWATSLCTIASLAATLSWEAAAAEKGKDVNKRKDAILLVAFGTSVAEAEGAYQNIERLCRRRFPDAALRWAYTSKIVRDKLAAAGRTLDSPLMALARLADEGYDRVTVQSLHVIPGEEYDEVTSAAKRFEGGAGGFRAVTVGLPLLAGPADMQRVVKELQALLPRERQAADAVVLMGHGARHHPSDARYAELARALRRADGKIILGTVEGKPPFEDVAQGLRNIQAQTIWLLPFMAVAGDHARNDLAGDDKESWKSQLEAAGFRCIPVLKGMAEYDGLAEIWLDHLATARQSLK